MYVCVKGGVDHAELRVRLGEIRLVRREISLLLLLLCMCVCLCECAVSGDDGTCVFVCVCVCVCVCVVSFLAHIFLIHICVSRYERIETYILFEDI